MLQETGVNGKYTILVVDDSKMIRSIHKDMLTEGGYNVVTAENGYEALEMFHKEKFDLVLTDLNMPKMDGYLLTQELRKLNQDVPIIIATTESQSHDIDKGVEVGADIFMVKPLKEDELIEKINLLI
ncbi:MAG: response regulator [Candidatus Heimdallarchaeaceae archaeon]